MNWIVNSSYSPVYVLVKICRNNKPLDIGYNKIFIFK